MKNKLTLKECVERIHRAKDLKRTALIGIARHMTYAKPTSHDVISDIENALPMHYDATKNEILTAINAFIELEDLKIKKEQIDARIEKLLTADD